jgi:uncharacterized protein YhaN
MRILRLNLKAFGPFTNQEINLSDGNYGLHVIYGPNEAGKSSSLRAINAVLFGIPGRTDDNFVHDNSLLRVGADLVCREGKELSFVRKKGNKNTLITPNEEEEITDLELQYFLKGITVERFFSEFALNHGELVKGGNIFLSNKGDVGQSLFVAGHGLIDLQSFVDEIREQASEIFTQNKRKGGILEFVKLFKEKKKEAKQSSVNTGSWDKLDKEYRQQQKSSQEIAAQIEQLSKDQSRLERLCITFPLIIKRNSLLEKLNTFKEFTPIPESIIEDRKNITNSIQKTSETIERNEIEIKQLVDEVEALDIPEAVIQRSSSILTLLEDLGSYKSAQKDMIGLQGEYEQIKTSIESMLNDIKPGMSFKEAQSLNLRTSERTEVESMTKEYDKIVDRLDSHKNNLRKVLSEYSQIRDKIDKMEKPLDIALLKKEIADITKEGDLHSSLNRINDQITLKKEEISIELVKMSIGDKDIDNVAKMNVPDLTTIDKYIKAFSTSDRYLEKSNEEIIRIRQEHDNYEAELKQLHAIGNVFSADNLKQIREERDKGWEFIKRAWLEDEGSSASATEYSRGLSLDQAFEGDIKKADEISDSRYDQADQVAKVDQLNIKLKTLEKDLSKASTENQTHIKAKTKHKAEWEALWEKSGIEPELPNEMRNWRHNLSSIWDKIKTLRYESSEMAAISKNITTSISRLNKCLEEKYNEDNLNSFLSYCELIVEKSEDITQMKNENETRISDYKNRETILLSEIKEYEQALKNWHVKWSELMSQFGLNPENSTTEVTTMIHQVQEVFIKHKELKEKETRIEQIKDATNLFEDNLEKLLKNLTPDLTSLSPLEASGRLREIVETAKSNQTKKTTLETELKKNKTTLEKDNISLRNQQKQIDELCCQASCNNIEELISKEDKSAQFRLLQVDLHSIEDQMINTGGGSVNEINKEAASTDRETVNLELEKIKSNMTSLLGNKTSVDQTVGERKNQLDGIDGGNIAAQAAEDAEAILTIIKEHALKYLKLTLALQVIEQEIECYRKKNESPLLAKASQYYMKLTLGSFTGLTISYEGEQPSIVGVRPDNRHTEVIEMSDGSRDQLYLSLRLAALSVYLEVSEPMPFIVDDILIKFDDDRARATLEILSEISDKTQVLFFTHQARHVDIAKTIDNTFTHNLAL